MLFIPFCSFIQSFSLKFKLQHRSNVFLKNSPGCTNSRSFSKKKSCRSQPTFSTHTFKRLQIASLLVCIYTQSTLCWVWVVTSGVTNGAKTWARKLEIDYKQELILFSCSVTLDQTSFTKGIHRSWTLPHKPIVFPQFCTCTTKRPEWPMHLM